MPDHQLQRRAIPSEPDAAFARLDTPTHNMNEPA